MQDDSTVAGYGSRAGVRSRPARRKAAASGQRPAGATGPSGCPPHPLSCPEERANFISHGVGLFVLLVAVPVLLGSAHARGDPLGTLAAGVFGGSAILVYLTSTLSHGLEEGRGRVTLELLDRAAIYLLIAGTYTPFTLGVLRGPVGWSLLSLVWALAAVGVALTLFGGERFPRLTMALYLGMGWLVLLASRPLIALMARPGLVLLLAGGVCYTVGVGFYSARRLRFNHLVWHLCVISGTACHYLAILWYAA